MSVSVSVFVCMMCVTLWYPAHVDINLFVVKIHVSAHVCLCLCVSVSLWVSLCVCVSVYVCV